MQLVILGMHRSGTSGVTRLLNMAGAYFGPEGAATEVNAENPKGFWERKDMRAVCDGLLIDSGFDWWKIAELDVDALPENVLERHGESFAKIVRGLDTHRPWVLKEPRLCLVLSILKRYLEVPVFVHVTREPLEVAESIAARNAFPRLVGIALWERYTLDSLASSAGHPRIHVRHEDLLADPVGTLRVLLSSLGGLGVGGLRMPSDAEIEAFIRPELHRQHRAVDDRRGVLNPEQLALAQAIDSGALFDEPWGTVPVSEGAQSALRSFESSREELRLAQQEVVEAKAEQRSMAQEAAAEQRSVERTKEDALAAARTLQRGLDRAERLLEPVEERARALEKSRSWKISRAMMSARQRYTPGYDVARDSPMTRIVAGLADSRSVITAALAAGAAERYPGGVEDLGGGVTLRSTAPHVTRSGRPKVAVISWDVGHNPLGRAYIMAQLLRHRFDVEIYGAQFERYGSDVWAPLRGMDIPVHIFEGRTLPGHLGAMERVAKRIDADAIWVSKPRFPSLGLGALTKLAANRPLVVDVDDHELSFFAADEGMALTDLARCAPEQLVWPFEQAWTQACEPLIGEADHVTVSNGALAARFGGTIVPHARDASLFDPEAHDRTAVRSRLGIGPNDRLLLFGGTPRVHKGIPEILDALDRLDDPRYKLALFGTRELDELRDQIGDRARWIVALPYQRFDELPSIVGAADLTCVLQDPSHPVARYQMPAKVSDALAMGVPCLVSDVPPLRPLIDEGVLHVHDPSRPLHEHIRSIFDDRDDALERARRGRKIFVEEYSNEAVCARIAPVFEQLIANPPPPSPALSALVDAPRSALPRGSAAAPVRRPGSRRWDAKPGEQYDLVMFWKQNDSSIYGRRQDMLLEYLRRSGRFRRIVHFDNPIAPEGLAATYRGSTGAADQRRLVVRQTLKRLAHRRDTDEVTRRTFLYGGGRSRRLGLPRRDRYHEYVSKVLADQGIGDRLTVFWVFPTNDDFPRLADELDPDLVVVDVVDDNRTWYEPGDDHHARVERNYREVLSRADVVLANCEPVAEGMEQFFAGVHLIPNGCELPDGSPPPTVPGELRALDGPLIGYVGNLSSRIDIDLLDHLAVARPRWQFVFVGSAHLDQTILRLDRHDNVHFVGVKPYDEVKRFVVAFDVALIPHVDNEMTKSMNPLKAFVYCAAGVPVVSTPIANIGELEQLITVAQGHHEFLAAIEHHLEMGKGPVDVEALRPHSWECRVDVVLTHLDEAAGATSP